MTEIAEHSPDQTSRDRSLMRRYAPVWGLLLLAPWIGEYLLGNVPLQSLIAIPFLIPLYGGGALLIREVTRRTRRGWPTILTLGLAYGLIEAGLVDQSLFNPSFETHSFQQVTPIPALGISAHFALTFIIGHAVWSVGIPIAIVELLTPGRRTTPWLGRTGLVPTMALYLFGCWIIFQDLRDTEEFLASGPQRIGTAIVSLGLICLALTFKKTPKTSTGFVPKPWLLGVGTFLVANAWFIRPESWVGVAIGALVPCAVAWLVCRWSRRESWTPRHEFALVAGALPTYAWAGFVLTAMIRPEDHVAWIGNVVFALMAVLLLVLTGRAVYSRMAA